MQPLRRQFDPWLPVLACWGMFSCGLALADQVRAQDPASLDAVCYEVVPLPDVRLAAFEARTQGNHVAPSQPSALVRAAEPVAGPPSDSPEMPASTWDTPPSEIAPQSHCQPQPTGVIPFAEVLADESCWDLNALARGYWLNDQRIEWTGLESTLGAEGQIAPSFRRQAGDWDLLAYGDFYLNQPFDRNVLLDTAERRSFAANFETEVFQISNLYLSATYGDFTFSLGKFETPFGRYYFPLMSNPRFDAPFIRTEAINWRETGLLIHHERGLFVTDVAVTNGSEDRDTNSSKALVARVGLQGENFAGGCSIKTQDGIGSEWQKTYENHLGADAMVRFGKWTLSGEMIFDEYGFRRPGHSQLDIFWGRSIYNRDIHNPSGEPLSSVGYYADLGYQGERWYLGFNYGVNDPVAVGNALHDQKINRGMIKTVYSLAPGFDFFGVFLLENGGFPAQANRDRKGELIYTGFQASF